MSIFDDDALTPEQAEAMLTTPLPAEHEAAIRADEREKIAVWLEEDNWRLAGLAEGIRNGEHNEER